MRINAIQNNTGSNVSFKELRIYNQYLWDPKVLYDFANNQEVLKFVKYFDDQGIDISAHRSFNGINNLIISMFPDNSFISTDIPYKKLGSFNASDAISKVIERQEKREQIDKAMQSVERLNKSLRKKQSTGVKSKEKTYRITNFLEKMRKTILQWISR